MLSSGLSALTSLTRGGTRGRREPPGSWENRLLQALVLSCVFHANRPANAPEWSVFRGSRHCVRPLEGAAGGQVVIRTRHRTLWLGLRACRHFRVLSAAGPAGGAVASMSETSVIRMKTTDQGMRNIKEAPKRIKQGIAGVKAIP